MPQPESDERPRGGVLAAAGEPGGPARRRRGERLPGARDLILSAARELFAERGYAGATIRAIAGRAGVDAALVMHFFPAKDRLFAAAMAFPPDLPRRIAAAVSGDFDGMAERLVRVYVDAWEDPTTSARFRAALGSIAANEQAIEALREFLQTSVLDVAARRLRPVPTVLALSQLFGAAVARYVVGVGPLAELGVDEFVAALTPAVDRSLRVAWIAPGTRADETVDS